MAHLTLVLALVRLVTISPHATDPSHASIPHVRYADDLIAATLEHGAGSPLFVDLIAAIQNSDVIVYIERGACRGRGTGKTEFISASGNTRYARITLNIGRAGDVEVALLGHELQHVVELVMAPSVRDVRSYRALYERIGFPATGRVSPAFETNAARDTGWWILGQLRRRVSPTATGKRIER